MRMVLALAIFLIIFISFIFYLYILVRRALRLLWKDATARKIRIVALIITAILLVPIFDFTSSWMIVLLHIAGFGVLCDIIFWLTKKWRGTRFHTLHQASVLPVILTIATLTYGYYNIYNVIRTHYTIETDKAIRDEGYKIAFISDLHMGLTLNEKELTSYAEKISAEKPDLVILGGDIVDERTTNEEVKIAFRALGKIKSTYGTYFVYGNHDQSNYLKESERNYTKKELDDAITSQHITILDDDVQSITNDFTLIGRRDLSLAPRATIKQLMNDTSADDFLFVVDHQPEEVANNDAAKADLMMSGHTHGGQIWPAGLFIKLMGTVSYGYRDYDHLQQIVSSGITGWGYPIRTEKHSEYVIVDVK